MIMIKMHWNCNGDRDHDACFNDGDHDDRWSSDGDSDDGQQDERAKVEQNHPDHDRNEP